MYTYDAEICPRYGETDQMGVIYHGNYYMYFEVGRSNFFRSLGYTYKRLEENGIILPVVESSCRYIKPVLYDEPVLIRTSVEMQKGVRIAFKYQVLRKEDGELLAEGRTMHAFVDSDLKPVRLRRLDPEFLKVLEKIKPVN